MYFQVFGGSALLHLLMGYPRLIALLGIAGTVALTGTSHGPGNYAGTGQYLARIDAVMTARLETTTESEDRALRAASQMLELDRVDDIEAAVDYTLRQCGPRCADLTTPIVIDDLDLLKRVLILYQLDKAAAASRTAGAVPTPPRTAESARR